MCKGSERGSPWFIVKVNCGHESRRWIDNPVMVHVNFPHGVEKPSSSKKMGKIKEGLVGNYGRSDGSP